MAVMSLVIDAIDRTRSALRLSSTRFVVVFSSNTESGVGLAQADPISNNSDRIHFIELLMPTSTDKMLPVPHFEK